MKYLYGNSNESNLDQNYLDYLRRTIDFCAAVLQSETRITGLRSDMVHARENATIEKEQLISLAGRVDALLESATDTHSRETTVACRNRLQLAAQNEFSRTDIDIASGLQNLTDAANAQILAERKANLKRFEEVLLYCDMPKTKKFVTVALNDSGSFEARLESITLDTLSSTIQLQIPSDHAFNEPFRIDRLMPDLQISIPDAGGWLKRSPKITLQKLTREYIAGFSQRPDGNRIELRSSMKDTQEGYHIRLTREAVHVTRMSKQETQPYEIAMEDAEQIRTLYAKLEETACGLEKNNRTLLSTVRIHSIPLESFFDPTQLVLWLLEQMTPVVLEISRNSLAPAELVLKRVLSDDRREEIFASKKELHDKLTLLTPEHKSHFDCLGLNRDNQHLQGLPAPSPSDLISAAEQSAPDDSADTVLIESSLTGLDLLKDEPTSEIDLTDLDDPPEPVSLSSSRSASIKTPSRPSVPPPRPSNPPPSGIPGTRLSPPRPSNAPGSPMRTPRK